MDQFHNTCLRVQVSQSPKDRLVQQVVLVHAEFQNLLHLGIEFTGKNWGYHL